MKFRAAETVGKMDHSLLNIAGLLILLAIVSSLPAIGVDFWDRLSTASEVLTIGSLEASRLS